MGGPTRVPWLDKWVKVVEGGPSLPSAEKVAFLSDVLGLSPVWPGSVGTGLNAIGAIMTGYDQYQKSTATTIPGKLYDATAAGAMDVAMGSNPGLAVADAVVGKIFEGLGIKGISISETANTSVRATTTLIEGIITWDETGMEDFHTKSMNGEYGPIFQKASQLGDYIFIGPWGYQAEWDQAKAVYEGGLAPKLKMSSSEEAGMKVTGVAYDTVPPPLPDPPRERNKCGSPGRGR